MGSENHMQAFDTALPDSHDQEAWIAYADVLSRG